MDLDSSVDADEVLRVSSTESRVSDSGHGGHPQPPLLADQEFIGIVTNLNWDQNDAITVLDDVQRTLTKLVQEIDLVKKN
jgi:hypothetical protein